ncbi:MAG: energy transducer TonB [Gammaproteobacteria bacterium]|nr:energy transducer TonB [Gammaproteobacteria bacterium]
MAAVAPGLTSPQVTASDRLTFTVFLALAIHAALILGITFTFKERAPATHTMEVTLAQSRSDNEPDRANFLAQFNQVGSGTLDEKKLTTTTTEAEFEDTKIRETTPQQQVASAPKQEKQEKTVVTTEAESRHAVAEETEIPDPKPAESDSPVEKTLLQRSLEIASLQARLAEQRQIYAKRPRIKRLTSLSTASSVDAFYLNSWRRKVEKVGNLNYPSEARREQIYGSLRLLVSIYPDGSLKEIEVLESSGHRILDDAAIDIVQLAAPLAPFPDNLRKMTDVLEIIRTWQFRKNSSLRSFSG